MQLQAVEHLKFDIGDRPRVEHLPRQGRAPGVLHVVDAGAQRQQPRLGTIARRQQQRDEDAQPDDRSRDDQRESAIIENAVQQVAQCELPVARLRFLLLGRRREIKHLVDCPRLLERAGAPYGRFLLPFH
ncbi:hypothetical protein [Sphingomonas sp. DC2300-3]|uniref:hypothetical protein n=1 Tax=unclassified Sphingomonas TaxID=196159 RepID=UPI003CF68C92